MLNKTAFLRKCFIDDFLFNYSALLRGTFKFDLLSFEYTLQYLLPSCFCRWDWPLVCGGSGFTGVMRMERSDSRNRIRAVNAKRINVPNWKWTVQSFSMALWRRQGFLEDPKLLVNWQAYCRKRGYQMLSHPLPTCHKLLGFSGLLSRDHWYNTRLSLNRRLHRRRQSSHCSEVRVAACSWM